MVDEVDSRVLAVANDVGAAPGFAMDRVDTLSGKTEATDEWRLERRLPPVVKEPAGVDLFELGALSA